MTEGVKYNGTEFCRCRTHLHGCRPAQCEQNPARRHYVMRYVLCFLYMSVCARARSVCLARAHAHAHAGARACTGPTPHGSAHVYFGALWRKVGGGAHSRALRGVAPDCQTCPCRSAAHHLPCHRHRDAYGRTARRTSALTCGQTAAEPYPLEQWRTARVALPPKRPDSHSPHAGFESKTREVLGQAFARGQGPARAFAPVVIWGWACAVHALPWTVPQVV